MKDYVSYDIRDHLSVLTKSKASKTKYHCPACQKDDLDINLRTGAYNCFSSGCNSKDIRAAIDKLEGKPEWKPEQDDWKKPVHPKSRKEYFYPDRDGKQLVKVVRVDYGDGRKKDFFQSHWNGSKWVNTNPDEVKKRIPIYRRAEVVEAIGRGELVFILEGEAAADALWELGIPATTTIGGAGKFSAYGDYTEDLDGGQFALVPDRDTAGVKHMGEIAEFLGERVNGYYLAGTQGLWKNPAGAMDIGDDIRDHQLTKEQILAKVISPQKYHQTVTTDRNTNPDEERENTQFLQIQLGNLLEIKGKKAPQIFQDNLGKSLQATANNFNIPLEILVFCLLPILSARIPSETRLLINPGTDYSVPALRWTALIGETGTKKSPVLKALLAPLLNLQKKIAAKYKAEKDIYDKDYSLWKTEKVDKRGEEPTPPAPMLDCYFSDFTIESIGQSISDRPDDSYLVFVDELAGFFKSMDAYRKGGGDRQKWLDLYNAGALKINRKGSPTIFCPHTSVSILGGLQPSVLAQMIKDDSSAEDGLWNRFMFCRLPQTKTDAFSDNSISLFECLLALYANLSSAPVIEHILSDAAKTLWKVWHDDIEDKVMAETSDLLRGTYAKAEGIAGRNALIIHRAIAAQQEGVFPEKAISCEVMAMAIEWTQWELGQTLLEYQRLGLTEDPELSRILRFIDKFEGKGWVNAVAVRPWWSGKVKPPVQEIRLFMTKVVKLGYAIDNGEAPTSGKYQILIDRKGSHVSHVLPENSSGQDIDGVTTLSHKISQSGDETATQSQIQNMTTVSHKVSHVLDNCSTAGTENDDSECQSSNMTKNMTKGSHVSKPTELRHPVDSLAENMTKGSHDPKSSSVNDYSEKVTNMTTFSSDENTRELANIESMAATLADVARLSDDAANEALADLYQVWATDEMTIASAHLKKTDPQAFKRVAELVRNRKSSDELEVAA